MTPVQLQVLLHVYVRGTRYPERFPSFIAAEHWLIEQGMISYKPLCEVELTITTRGICFVDHVKSLPLPTESRKWEMPKSC